MSCGERDPEYDEKLQHLKEEADRILKSQLDIRQAINDDLCLTGFRFGVRVAELAIGPIQTEAVLKVIQRIADGEETTLDPGVRQLWQSEQVDEWLQSERRFAGIARDHLLGENKREQ